MVKANVVITGASSGIGEAIAKVFDEAGYTVILLARNKDKMESLNLANSYCYSVDVTEYEQVRDTINDIEKNIGPIDCLINNAGVAVAGEFSGQSEKEQASMVDVNIKGVIHGMEAVLPGMQERQGGTVINMSSIADRKSCPNLATYGATKAAVRSLTESLREANAKHNIRFCNLAPALIKTPIQAAAGLQRNPDDLIDVNDFAKAVLWVYQQPASICVRDLVFAPTNYED